MEFSNPVRRGHTLASATAAWTTVVLVGALAGCGEAPATPAESISSPRQSTVAPQTGMNAAKSGGAHQDSSASDRRPVVLLISVDALNPSAIAALGSRRAPNLTRLAREGACTFNARTAYEQTNTLPNHTGMLTGLPINGPAGHHVTFNEEHPGNLASLGGHYVPGIFDSVHDSGMSTAFYAAKPKFEFLIRSWDAAAGAPDRTGADNGRSKLDTAEVADDPVLVHRVVTQLDSHPVNLTFLHLRGADDAGHGDDRDGFMGPKYLDAVALIDQEIGLVLAALDARPALERRTTIVLTADHGGAGTDAGPGLGHRNPTVLANYRIPFIVWGRGASAGADLYAVNKRGRADPGDARPTYSGRQPIRNLDAADLVLALLDQPPIPGTLRGGRALLASSSAGFPD